AIARTEVCCTLTDAVTAARWLLQTGGSLDLVHRPERLTDVLTALRAAGLEPKRLRLVRHRADKQPSLVLIRAVLGGRPGLAVEPDCVLYEADGAPSADYRRIYHLQERNESCPESST
ncbi:MAG: SAM-dependent methyltransferase, partial [Oscillospiraceae bacterium]|nr:SAM-dependent methyltransferase [Oscillospiraceae bacterium]